MASERDSQQDANEQTDQTDQGDGGAGGAGGEQQGTKAPPREEPVYNDRSKLDFDPDDGLYTGTAVEGGTDIPGPHESVDDVVPANGADGGDTADDGDADR